MEEWLSGAGDREIGRGKRIQTLAKTSVFLAFSLGNNAQRSLHDMYLLQRTLVEEGLRIRTLESQPFQSLHLLTL